MGYVLYALVAVKTTALIGAPTDLAAAMVPI
jgi:hypothetical protein